MGGGFGDQHIGGQNVEILLDLEELFFDDLKSRGIARDQLTNRITGNGWKPYQLSGFAENLRHLINIIQLEDQ